MPGPLDTANRFGGEVVKDFRQGAPDSYGWINLDPATREGACMALSCLWIVKARKDENFYDWVTKPAGVKAINQMQTSPTYGSAPSRIENRIRFFEQNGLARAGNAKINIDPFDVQCIAMTLSRATDTGRSPSAATPAAMPSRPSCRMPSAASSI